jgi:LysR family transcriptional regulator, nitrogen assimilation regulatory protein
MEKIFAAAGVAPRIVTESNVLSVLLSAVEAGIGGTILAKGDFSDMSGHRGLVAIAIEPPIHFTASIVTSSTAPLSRAGEAVRQLLVRFFASQLRENPPPGAEWIGGPAIANGDTPITR